MKSTYSKGQSQNVQLTEGTYTVMITRADIQNVKGTNKLIVDFALENGDIKTEFIKLEAWVPLFKDLLEASGQEFSEDGGDFDTDYIIGLEGTLEVVKNEGKGKYEGTTFYNAEHFAKKEEAEVKKN